MTGTERSTEEEQEGAERGKTDKKTDAQGRTLIERQRRRQRWTGEREGVGRNREIYIHMRYKQGKKDIKMVVSALNPTGRHQNINQHIQLGNVAFSDASMSSQGRSWQR